MRDHSTRTTITYHLGALWRSLRLWLGDFRVSVQDWTERNVVAPEPTRYEKPAIEATVSPWAQGAGMVCPDGERAEFWVTGSDDEAKVEAYLQRIRFVEAG